MTIVTSLLLMLVGYIDWSRRRIPNILNATLFVWSLVVFFAGFGINTYQWLINIALALAITLPGYLSGRLGGGDVKLLLALSPLWPPMKMLAIFAFGVLSMAMLMSLAGLSGRRASYHQRGLPLGTAVFLGAIAFLLYQNALLSL
jgi:prepilin peptidase CpaA